MQSLIKNGYSDKEIESALLSNRQIKFEYDLLDKHDKKIGNLEEVSGSYSFNAEAGIKGAGRFNLNERYAKDIDFLSERIRPYFCLYINGEWVRWEQGIYLLSSPDRYQSNGGTYRDIEAYDKGVILSEDKVDNRYLIPANTRYTDAIRTLVLSTGIDKISLQESDLELSIDKEYEIGTSKLEIINSLLLSINYESVYFDSNGFCMVKKKLGTKERNYDFKYLTDSKSVIIYGARETIDVFNVPNKFVRYIENPETGYLISTFINDRASNKLSTVNRGRVITDIQSITDIADQVTLNEYVKNVAESKSQVFGGITFTTVSMPHHSFKDCLFVKVSDLGFAEKVIETAWSIDTTKGLMTHTCKKVVELW